MAHRLDQRLTAVRLVEMYGRLLTDSQFRLLRRYYLDDWSLGEIAIEREITRQAVFDSLRRSLEELRRLERSLRLVESAERQRRRGQHAASRLEDLERSVGALAGRVDRKTLRTIMGRLAALRRTVL